MITALFFGGLAFSQSNSKTSHLSCEISLEADQEDIQLLRSSPASTDESIPLAVAEPGSIFAVLPEIRQATLRVVSQLRKSLTALNHQTNDPLTQTDESLMSERFDAVMQIRDQVVAGLEAERELCSQCAPFLAELDRVSTRIRKLTERYRNTRDKEIADKVKLIAVKGEEKPWGAWIGDALGLTGELYGFGMYREPRRGVLLKNYLSEAAGNKELNVYQVFRENELDTRLISKEADLIVDGNQTWVEIKAMNMQDPHRGSWKKLKAQLRDNLTVIWAQTKGLRFRQRILLFQTELKRLRYFFIGGIPANRRHILEAVVRDQQDKLGVPMSLRIPVEFLSIPFVQLQ